VVSDTYLFLAFPDKYALVILLCVCVCVCVCVYVFTETCIVTRPLLYTIVCGVGWVGVGVGVILF
jgi:hypothetical protein